MREYTAMVRTKQGRETVTVMADNAGDAIARLLRMNYEILWLL